MNPITSQLNTEHDYSTQSVSCNNYNQYKLSDQTKFNTNKRDVISSDHSIHPSNLIPEKTQLPKAIEMIESKTEIPSHDLVEFLKTLSKSVLTKLKKYIETKIKTNKTFFQNNPNAKIINDNVDQLLKNPTNQQSDTQIYNSLPTEQPQLQTNEIHQQTYNYSDQIRNLINKPCTETTQYQGIFDQIKHPEVMLQIIKSNSPKHLTQHQHFQSYATAAANWINNYISTTEYQTMQTSDKLINLQNLLKIYINSTNNLDTNFDQSHPITQSIINIVNEAKSLYNNDKNININDILNIVNQAWDWNSSQNNDIFYQPCSDILQAASKNHQLDKIDTNLLIWSTWYIVDNNKTNQLPEITKESMTYIQHRTNDSDIFNKLSIDALARSLDIFSKNNEVWNKGQEAAIRIYHDATYLEDPATVQNLCKALQIKVKEDKIDSSNIKTYLDKIKEKIKHTPHNEQ